MAEKGPAFQLTRDTLKAKQKSLKKMGKGNKEQAAKPLTDEEIDILYAKGLLGGGSPTALLNTVWLNNTMQFGLRGTQENYNLQWGDVKLKRDSSGEEYLELNERQTKTRTGENVNDIRKVAPRMYATPQDPERDPVKIYKIYSDKRPLFYSKPDDPFYIAPRTVPLEVGDETSNWFIKQKIGAKKLGSVMKTMAIAALLDGGKKITNHSARKTMVQKLRNAGVAPTSIMNISGHKNMQSVLNYSEMAESEQRQCSKILSSTSTSLLCNSDQANNGNLSLTHPCSILNTVNNSQNHQNLIQFIFAGATLNIQTLNVHMK